MSITYLPGKEPHPRETRRILKNVNREGWNTSIDCYLADGGYEELKKALGMEPRAVIDEVKKSGLRGRGGAGFPTGVKWTFIPPNNTKPVYLVCNCDESEPGTFKDRYIVHQDPHQLIEGMVISSYAVGAHQAYIYMREEFPIAAEIMLKALQEARERGFLGSNIQGSGYNLEIHLHRGAGAYICGEETALLNSLEGDRPYPRIKPPYFPAAIGLYGCPTIVNNVESLCQVKHIMAMGGEAYSQEGAKRSPGTRIIGVSGDVKRPGFYEIVSGSMTFGELLYDVCGGPRDGRQFKAVIPGGSSSKVMRTDAEYKVQNPDGTMGKITFFDIPLDLDSIAQHGSMSGSGAVIVMDDSRSMPWAMTPGWASSNAVSSAASDCPRCSWRRTTWPATGATSSYSPPAPLAEAPTPATALSACSKALRALARRAWACSWRAAAITPSASKVASRRAACSAAVASLRARASSPRAASSSRLWMRASTWPARTLAPSSTSTCVATPP